jgi:hypothetical protein
MNNLVRSVVAAMTNVTSSGCNSSVNSSSWALWHAVVVGHNNSRMLKMLILKGLGAYTLALLGPFLQFGFLLCP